MPSSGQLSRADRGFGWMMTAPGLAALLLVVLFPVLFTIFTSAFDYTLLPQEHSAGIWDDGGFPQGEIHLDGTQALAYSRARYHDLDAAFQGSPAVGGVGRDHRCHDQARRIVPATQNP